MSGEGWKTYNRRIRYRMNNAIKRLKNNINSNIFIEIFLKKPVKPRGCPCCAYSKKHYMSPVRINHPKKNKHHNSTLMRNSYQILAKLKKSTRI